MKQVAEEANEFMKDIPENEIYQIILRLTFCSPRVHRPNVHVSCRDLLQQCIFFSLQGKELHKRKFCNHN